jgi:hypothetical protein
MTPESPKADGEKAVAPQGQAIEYALILQRMIDAVQEDPSQMRLAIYEFARARLKGDTPWLDDSDRERLSVALETAIQGVEQFSTRQGERDLLPPPVSAEESRRGLALASAPHVSAAVVTPITPADEDILVQQRVRFAPEIRIVEVDRRELGSNLIRFAIVLLLFGSIGTLVYYKARSPAQREHAPPSEVSTATNPGGDAQKPDRAPPLPEAAPAPAASPGFPLPTDYGVYALHGDELSELSALAERVPDKRIAISTPVNRSSRTRVGDGKVRFILFRRDLAAVAPERAEVRVVAQVVRAVTFDARGKPNFNPVSDAWNIRSISYELRVRPIAGHPEMLLVQSDKPDFVLSPGRYVLVVGDQGYDFTVAGKVTDLAQCLERTDAANGSFYSECQKP